MSLGDGESAHQLVLFRVGSDPKPEQTILGLNAKSTVSATDPNRSESTDLLELKRGKLRVAFELLETAPRPLPDRFRQGIEQLPEFRGGVMLQMSRSSPRL